MFKKLCTLTIGLVALSFSNNAQATIVDNGNITTDTDTGLNWLDLTQTYNMTVAQVLTQMGAGDLFDGYRLALAEEVHTLMSNAGLPVSTTTETITSDAQDLAEANALTALLGDTVGPQFGGIYYGSRGHLDDNGSDRVVGYYLINQSSLFNDYFTGYPDWQGAGVWLVQTDVPEPAPLALLGLGLLGFAYKRKKQHA